MEQVIDQEQLQTSEQWWEQVKNDETLLIDWLQKQYHSEVMAAGRINMFAGNYADPLSREARILNVIANQELDHANWVGDLLVARGIEPAVIEKEEPYWDATLPQIESFNSGAAVAAHAERMRLERIRVIANDEQAPEDIRAVFARILPQEEFHERAFRQMAGDEAMSSTAEAHQLGRQLLHLIPKDI